MDGDEGGAGREEQGLRAGRERVQSANRPRGGGGRQVRAGCGKGRREVLGLSSGRLCDGEGGAGSSTVGAGLNGPACLKEGGRAGYVDGGRISGLGVAKALGLFS